MKTKNIIPIMLVAITILSCCLSVSAINDPVDKTTLDYRDFEYLLFVSPLEVDLEYIDSELPSNALTLEYIDYYPSTNETKYRATSNQITPDPWFIPGIHSFYYQDMNTGQIYRINVDYTDVVPPPSNTQLELLSLQENHTQLQSDYNNLYSNFLNQTNILTSLNTTISLYTNITSSNNLTNVTQTLVDEYLLISENLNKAFEEINMISENLNETTNAYDDMELLYNSLVTTYYNLETGFEQLNTSYNTTYNALLNSGKNLSAYKTFIDDLKGYGSEQIYFQGSYYMPISYYTGQITKLEGDIGLLPVWIILAVIITFLIMFVIFKYLVGKDTPTPMEMESKFGYDPDADKIDRFSLGRIVKQFSKKPEPKENNPGISQETNPEPVDEIKNLREELDQKIDQKIEPIKTEMTDIHTAVDKILENMTPGGK